MNDTITLVDCTLSDFLGLFSINRGSLASYPLQKVIRKVSVGMFEHVGVIHYDESFSVGCPTPCARGWPGGLRRIGEQHATQVRFEVAGLNAVGQFAYSRWRKQLFGGGAVRTQSRPDGLRSVLKPCVVVGDARHFPVKKPLDVRPVGIDTYELRTRFLERVHLRADMRMVRGDLHMVGLAGHDNDGDIGDFPHRIRNKPRRITISPELNGFGQRRHVGRALVAEERSLFRSPHQSHGIPTLASGAHVKHGRLQAVIVCGFALAITIHIEEQATDQSRCGRIAKPAGSEWAEFEIDSEGQFA